MIFLGRYGYAFSLLSLTFALLFQASCKKPLFANCEELPNGGNMQQINVKLTGSLNLAGSSIYIKAYGKQDGMLLSADAIHAIPNPTQVFPVCFSRDVDEGDYNITASVFNDRNEIIALGDTTLRVPTQNVDIVLELVPLPIGAGGWVKMRPSAIKKTETFTAIRGYDLPQENSKGPAVASVWAATSLGRVMHWDGQYWREVGKDIQGLSYRAIDVLDDKNMFAAGANMQSGIVFQYRRQNYKQSPPMDSRQCDEMGGTAKDPLGKSVSALTVHRTVPFILLKSSVLSWNAGLMCYCTEKILKSKFPNLTILDIASNENELYGGVWALTERSFVTNSATKDAVPKFDMSGSADMADRRDMVSVPDQSSLPDLSTSNCGTLKLPIEEYSFLDEIPSLVKGKIRVATASSIWGLDSNRAVHFALNTRKFATKVIPENTMSLEYEAIDAQSVGENSLYILLSKKTDRSNSKIIQCEMLNSDEMICGTDGRLNLSVQLLDSPPSSFWMSPSTKDIWVATSDGSILYRKGSP